MSDIEEVAQLVLHERQGRDRGWWDQMRACFAEDSAVSLSWFQGSGPDFVEQSEAMTRAGGGSLHRLGPPIVHVEGDRAVVELPTAIEARVDVNGQQADLSSYCRVLYRAQRFERWQIVSLDCIYERDAILPVVPGAALAIDAAELSAFREPYRMLAYHLSKRGYEVDNDLYGDDRPAELAGLYERTFAWLREVGDGTSRGGPRRS